MTNTYTYPELWSEVVQRNLEIQGRPTLIE